MNKKLIIQRFSKAAASYDQEAIVQKQIAKKMAQLIAKHIPAPCHSVLEAGCGTGLFTRMLIDTLQPVKLTLNDICPEMESCFNNLPVHQVGFAWGDAETVPFPEQQDLIASCSALQWFDSPKHFFERCTHTLTSNGHLAFSTFGSRNMEEITALTGNSLPYPDKEILEEQLGHWYKVIYSEEEIIRLHFDSPVDVLYHLKKTGVTALREKFWTRGDIRHFSEQYRQHFGNEKGVSLTYQPIYIIAKKNKQTNNA